MFHERKVEYNPGVTLTHHFKIWFGTHLTEKVVKPLEIQHQLNPSNDMVLFVNKEILENENNKAFLKRLVNSHVQIVEALSVLNQSDINELRLKYAIERMINKGLTYLKKAELHKSKQFQILGFRCFAAASDITRCLKSVMEYKCKEGGYRVYSDTDYYLFKIPDQIPVTCLLGTAEEKFEAEFNQTIRHNNFGMDINFIAIPSTHPWINRVRENWVDYFELSDYQPDTNLRTVSYVDDKKEILSLDGFATVPERSNELIDSYLSSPQPAATAFYTLHKAITSSFYANERILIDRRLDEIVFINMKQGTWYGKEEIIFNSEITINELMNQIELIISKLAFNTEKNNPLMGKELLKFLILGDVIPNIELKNLGDIKNDYKVTIPANKKTAFLEKMGAFIVAYHLEPYLKGELRADILSYPNEFHEEKLKSTKPR